jgi:hypothetical protein
MVWMVSTLELVRDDPGAQNELTQVIRAAQHEYSALQRVILLGDSSEPNAYLIVSEWAGHEALAEAMRSGLLWVQRGRTAQWADGPIRVYDEVVNIAD